ncbi:ribonuclease H-like domain-containing protein [Haloimpatiens sp. FM7315]|uniref:ribonuclease H-like domain-containing protein n=1 Tax=Haloimpatiens sp. FM7315 TaxID=3298609 RepID=UPI0035A31F7A
MILKESVHKISLDDLSYSLLFSLDDEFFKQALYFDLEHYVNKKPICVGVFGCSYYDENIKSLVTTQYMIENQEDSKEVLYKAEEYFITMRDKFKKKYIVTFAGNNDFSVINYLFKKNEISLNVRDTFKEIDLQKEYEKKTGGSIGLKNLEKIFNIKRETEIIKGQNLAKTFKKIMKDRDYINRMPKEKKERILFYNEQDVISLFYISLYWNKYIKDL